MTDLWCVHLSKNDEECQRKPSWGLLHAGESSDMEFHSCNKHLHKLIDSQATVWKL